MSKNHSLRSAVRLALATGYGKSTLTRRVAQCAILTGAATPGGVFGLAFQSASFAALLNFLETQGTVHVLSSPRIATLNNQKAVIKVGTDEFFVTNVSTTSTSTPPWMSCACRLATAALVRCRLL